MAVTEWANEDGEFLLADGSFGNPGCDGCGELDAVVKVDGQYLCKYGYQRLPPHEHQWFTTGGAWRCDCGATEPRLIGPGV